MCRGGGCGGGGERRPWAGGLEPDWLQAGACSTTPRSLEGRGSESPGVGSHILESQTTSLRRRKGSDLCPSLIIEAILLKESAERQKCQCPRQVSEGSNIPVAIFPLRGKKRSEKRRKKRSGKASRPHPPRLIILPTAPEFHHPAALALVPDSKPTVEYGGRGHFGQAVEEEDLARAGARLGHVSLRSTGRTSAARPFADSVPSLHPSVRPSSLSLPLSFFLA